MRSPSVASLPALLAATLLALAGCASDQPPTPTARAVATPPYLPLGDDYATDVALDGTASSDGSSGDGGALVYRWAVDDPHLRIVSGGLGDGQLTVRVAALAPTRVDLTVTSAAGASASTTLYLGVTLPSDM